jgi:hypothetical protein
MVSLHGPVSRVTGVSRPGFDTRPSTHTEFASTAMPHLGPPNGHRGTAHFPREVIASPSCTLTSRMTGSIPPCCYIHLESTNSDTSNKFVFVRNVSVLGRTEWIVSSIFIIHFCNKIEICTACCLQIFFIGHEKQESWDVIILYLININLANNRDTPKN